jgi:hypothetical protein
MAEGQRIIDLDAVKTIGVKIGGKDFQITQQRRAVLEKVVQKIFAQGERERPASADTEDKEFLRVAFQEWEDSLPVIALILGYEETSAETPGIIEHLREHLSFPGATQLFQEWWRLNQVDRFFGRAGNPLIPEQVMAEVAQKVDGEAVST